MASISSLGSIKGLSLWLDSTDLSTFVTSISQTDVIQWNDKSSNRYQFVPLRSNDRPKISTSGLSSVAVLFDQVSSFQLISKSKIPANSTLDFFTIVTPYSLWGPRQPFFDSADITVSETDTRFNAQIYADGNEIIRSVSLQTTAQGNTIFQGELFIGSDRAQSPNYLQRYNRTNRAFEYFPPPLCNGNVGSLAVFQGTMFASAGSNWEFYNPVSSPTQFISTNYLSTFTGPLTVYNRQLYSLPLTSWENYFTRNTVTPYPPGYSNVLYRWDSSINNFSSIFNISFGASNQYWDTDPITYNSNLFVYKGDMYINMSNQTFGSYLFRYNDDNVIFNLKNLAPGILGYTGMYYGSLIIPYNNSKLYRWNENLTNWFSRTTFPVGGRQGGFCTYKGQMMILRNGYYGDPSAWWTVTCNVLEAIPGLFGGTYSNSRSVQVTTNFRLQNGNNTSNLMIVHDGKLFFQANQSNIIYEYGEGTSLDQSFSTLVGAPILMQIRKTPTASQLFLNGTLVETEYTNFTFSNQLPREMFIGGAAGTLASGTSDAGSDHLQGAIHTIAQYNEILSSSDKEKVEGILAWTYGIQNVLPASHPYRNSSP